MRPGHRTRSPSPGQQNARHSAYEAAHATVAYRWHPLFGQRLRLREGARRGRVDVVLVEDQPGRLRELPRWMTDAAVCAAMGLFNTLMAKALSYDGAKSVLGQMHAADVKPNVDTFNKLISRAGDYQQAKRVLEQMQAAGITPSDATATALAKFMTTVAQTST